LILGGAEKAYHRHVAETLVVCPGWCVGSGGDVAFTLVNTEETPWTVETFLVEE